MSFRRKLILLLLLVAAVPVALSGVLSIQTSQKEMTSRIGDFQRKSASLVAEAINDFLLEAVTSLKLSTQFIPFDQFPEEDLPVALRIPYRQFDFVNILALLDQNGTQLSEPAFETSPEKAEALLNHEPVTVEQVEEFGRHIPLQAALATGVAFGPVYFPKDAQTPRVALAIAFPTREGKDRWVLAVEISLRKIQTKALTVATGAGETVFVVDGEGRVVYHPEASLMQQRASLAKLPVVSDGLKNRQAVSRRYTPPDGQEMVGVFAPIPLLGWGLVVALPVKEAFIAARRMQSYTLFWVGLSLLVAILGGALLARGVSGPVGELAAGTLDLAKGNFDRRIPVRSRDEIGRLAETFNQMTTELKQSFTTISDQNQEILEKNREIERWNQELQQRVEERTRELRQAEEQIIHSQKLAAVGELGAGVAHEINNPLTGIQGFAQLMLSQTKPEERFHQYLGQIVRESDRIRTIVGDLLRFTQAPGGEERTKVDLNAVLLNALRMAESGLQEREIIVHKDFATDLPPVSGDTINLQQVFLHIINNARSAMSKGGELTLQTKSLEGGAVNVAVSDTGCGIPKENLTRIFEPFFTTKSERSARGLGLSVANRIVEEHHGQIRVESKVGTGSTFTVILPGLRNRLHLK